MPLIPDKNFIPIGPVELLFGYWKHPKLPKAYQLNRMLWSFLAVFLISLGVSWYLLKDEFRGIPASQGLRSLEEDSLIPFWLISEGFAFALAAMTAMSGTGNWSDKGSLVELALTGMRPVLIGRIILAGPLRLAQGIIIALGLGLMFALVFLFNPARVFVVLIPVLLNTLLTLVMAHWVLLVLLLGDKRLIFVLFEYLMFIVVFVLITLLIVLIAVEGGALAKEFSHASFDKVLFVTTVAFLLALLPAKVIWVRVWAKHFENAVFSSLKF